MINLKFVKEKPLPSTKSCCIIIDDSIHFAGVMKLVDVADSKSAAGDSVPVRVRSPAPRKLRLHGNLSFRTKCALAGT